MASLNQATGLDMMELSQNVIITRKLQRMRKWTLRVRVGVTLLRFACWVLPFGVEIIEAKEPWLFYCPCCKMETSGEILGSLFTQLCQKCNRTFLALSYDVGNKARAIQHPDCNQGCHYAEPFGWVVSADCARHDGMPS